jgi:hemerythrin-like domain-containing protein
MTITQILTDHHETLRDLFKKTESDHLMFSELKKHLRVHHTNEEKFLYDLLEEKAETRKDALEAVGEHHIIELIMLELEDFPIDHERWAIKLENLEEYTRHHLKEEEADIFPQADKVLGADQAEKLGAQFEATMQKQLAVL